MFPLPTTVRRAVSAAAVAALGALAATGCSGQNTSANPASNGISFVSGNGNTAFYKAGSRPAAPGVSGTTLSGATFSLGANRGKVVVLNFWGSWCAPCRSEAPALAALSQRFQPKGVQFVGVDIRDSDASAEAFLHNFHIGYPILNDPADEIALAFRGTVPPSAIPSTLVIDRSGHIAGRVIGEATYSSLNSLLTKVTAGT